MSSGAPAPTRFVLLGGYLGAGKTSLSLRLGRELKQDWNKSVSIITNDQGNVLVDTEFMKNAGFDVSEVRGACFCVKFEDFVRSARGMVAVSSPDVILAEPIGTSTSILESVVSPLRSLYRQEFSVAPLIVVVDGSRVSDAVGEASDEFSQGLSIPLHQLREAEVIVISKCDLLRKDEIEAAMRRLELESPNAEVISHSSITGMNNARIVEIILSDRESTKESVMVDQRLFATQKASLGWYNAVAGLRPSGRLDAYAYLMSVLKRVSEAFGTAAVAHVKAVLSSPSMAMKVSLVSDSIQVDGLKGGRYLEGEGRIVLNARVSASPGELRERIGGALRSASTEFDVTLADAQEACFTPKPEAPARFVGP